jgi:murein DD-endopeptidase MepM/ murein hydrolase activator NlpD
MMILLFTIFIILTSMIGCGNETGSIDYVNVNGDAVLSDTLANKDSIEADEEISAANRQVLINESLMTLPDKVGHEGTVRYYLPFEAGKHRGVSQGINGSTSHKGKLVYAIDWNLTGYNDFRLPVLASAPGTVVLAEMLVRFGNCVVIRHVDGSKTRYAHLDEKYVTIGQYVGQAEKIGLVGTTGHSTGPHLHFEIMDEQMNDIYPIFMESIIIPVGDMSCTTDSDESGCYVSQNSPSSESDPNGSGNVYR